MSHDARVIEVLSEQLEIPASRVTRDALIIDDLGVDAVGLTEMVLALEEAFEVEISDAEIDRFSTVGNYIDFINRHAR